MVVRIGIVGSRRRDAQKDKDQLLDVLMQLSFLDRPDVSFVSGGCPKGGDRFAEEIADEYGISIVIYKADWKRFGKGAGFKRNVLIAENCDVLVALVAKDRKGGTEHTIKCAEKLDKATITLIE